MLPPTIYEYRTGQARQVVSFLREATLRWSSHTDPDAMVEHWKWKHLDNPVGASYTALAEAEGRTIGCLHNMPLRFKIGDRFIRATYGTDLAVHPDYRRRGLYYRILEKLKTLIERDRIEFCYWNTRNPVITPTYERDNAHMPLEFAKFIMVADVGLHLRMRPAKNAMIKSLGYRLLDLRSKLLKIGLKKSPATSPFDITETDRFDDLADEFWREAAQPFTLIGERNRDFLNWRFLDSRAGKFAAKLAIENKKMIAYIITRIGRKDPGYPEGFIVDMLALPGRLDASETLLRDAIGQFRRSDINAVHCMLPTSSPYASVLHRCGFVDTRFRETVFLNIMGSDPRIVQSMGSKTSGCHHLTYADFDMI